MARKKETALRDRVEMLSDAQIEKWLKNHYNAAAMGLRVGEIDAKKARLFEREQLRRSGALERVLSIQ